MTADGEKLARSFKIFAFVTGGTAIYFFLVNYHQRLLSILNRFKRKNEIHGNPFRPALPSDYTEYADLFISPADKYGVTAMVTDTPVKTNDIVLSIGVPDWCTNFSGGQKRFIKTFRVPHRILRVIATEGDIVKYNGIDIKIRKDHVWVGNAVFFFCFF